VIINRSDSGVETARDFCKARGVDIIAEIPNDRKIAEICSRGDLFCEKIPDNNSVFENIWGAVLERALL
jgi:MinD superfamily P-loop ATPase